ncbi:MAG: DUF1588 domain-containing protein [Lentisphaeraceae bacterium]|nr:DUF1588 domain-containing protein [Lentisphaeraceae bacterium]
MLRDPKSDNFYKDFTHQWLDMDRLDFFEFDEEKFPTFGKTMKYFAAEEVYQTVKTIVMENLGSENLLKSDFVVVNGMLAVHYGIEGVEGDAFRKVTLGEQSIRGGLTGMAAIMAMGSDGKKSSPVERGAWVLRKILNQPPPPAPANVPQLGRLEGQNLTAREILLAHQAEPQCAHCHKKIDPLGFGLENFGPTGEWRTEITLNEKSKTKKVKETKTYKVDASGSLFNGPKFRNYSELRDIFVSRQDDFNRGLISNMLSYALGRPSGFSDQELIDELHTEMKDKNNSIKALIYAIVKSAPFRMKR